MKKSLVKFKTTTSNKGIRYSRAPQEWGKRRYNAQSCGDPADRCLHVATPSWFPMRINAAISIIENVLSNDFR